MTPLIKLKSIGKSFVLPRGQQIEILQALDLDVDTGESVAIYGRSGSGKTTLLNILGMLDQPTSGSYLLNDEDTSGLTDSDRARIRGKEIGFIFQQFHLLDRRTALQNVAEPMLFGGRNEFRERHVCAVSLLERIGLADRAHSMPHLLSGGEQQRVAIARALVRSPRLVLADEPTGSLDQSTGEQVLDLLFGIAKTEQVALVVVTHEQSVAERADRVLFMSNGQLGATL